MSASTHRDENGNLKTTLDARGLNNAPNSFEALALKKV